ncbi:MULTISPECIES: hypothetical protein [unclassified Tychonema]|uniref:hypothetical protein n=1 Tax=unclassified Tychonema TaxID=2642144 RepID=UPI0018822ACE|nr:MULTISPECIES: hypothetical protein [unclassified Tychonema]MBE9093350.1 hypothetical protein [Tychonema sp. LEGE 07203]MBE9122995.1 hypothetical protein [Tychonema sp. LEGE 07199]MBE9133628.1 hypothetical protein [Tychonema sp. LEGE 07196]
MNDFLPQRPQRAQREERVLYGFGSIECAVDRLYWNIWLSAIQGRETTKVITTNFIMII